MNDIILEAKNTSKRYGGNLALDRVHFRAVRNKINVLIGENGAGKSTLMRILSGVESADHGELLLDGRALRLTSPRDAAAHGIAIVHQELAVLPNLNVSDNIFAGRELRHAGVFLDRRSEDAQSTDALRRLQHPLPPERIASELPLGCRQLVELARALAKGARILILDEPTSALSMPEAESLFRVLHELRASGVTIIYISHRLHELMHLGDTFTVLRSGRVVGEAVRGEVTRAWIVERMSGRDTTPSAPRAQQFEHPVLRLDRLRPATIPFAEATFTLHRGEVLGIYGLLGAGRTELLETIAGASRVQSGSMQLNGKIFSPQNVTHAIREGIAFVPEDRQRDGLIPELSIRENIALAGRGSALLSRKDETTRARELVATLRIAVRDLELPVTALSGGNQQKVLLARCLMNSPTILLLDEPTRGVDVGAKADIYAALHTLAASGLSILFTSSEIEEMRALATRSLVLCQGRIAAEFPGNAFTDEELFRSASPAVISSQSAAHPAGVSA